MLKTELLYDKLIPNKYPQSEEYCIKTRYLRYQFLKPNHNTGLGDFFFMGVSGSHTAIQGYHTRCGAQLLFSSLWKPAVCCCVQNSRC